MRPPGGIGVTRLTQPEISALIDPPEGKLYYNTTTNAYQYWNGSAWKVMDTDGGGSNLIDPWAPSTYYSEGVAVTESNLLWVRNTAGTSGLTFDAAEQANWDKIGADPADFIPLSEKGAANGVATLDASSKLPAAQLPTSVMEYLGSYDIVTNTPTLVDGIGDNGDFYKCSTAGSRDFGSGTITVGIGDALIYNGSIWERIPADDAVASVNSKIGVVVLNPDDLDDSLTTNKFVTQTQIDSFHDKNKDTKLDEGGANEVTAAQAKTAYTHSQVTSGNPHTVTKTEVGLGNVTNDAQLKRAASDWTGFTEETSPADDDMVLMERDSDGAKRKVKRSNVIGIEPQSVNSQTYTNSTSATYAAISGMSITPGAGDYLLIFTGSVTNENEDGDFYVAAHVNGTIVASGERRVEKIKTRVIPMALHCEITVGAAEVVDIKWKTATGTMGMYDRVLTLIKKA